MKNLTKRYLSQTAPQFYSVHCLICNLSEYHQLYKWSYSVWVASYQTA